MTDNNPLNTSNEQGEVFEDSSPAISPAALERQKAVKDVKEDKKSYPEPGNEVKHLFSTARCTAIDLIYWKNPHWSAIVLSSALAICVLFYYYSVSSIYAAIAFFWLFCDWAYVVGSKRLQSLLRVRKVTHPYHWLLSDKPFLIRREQADKHLDVILDLVNCVMDEEVKILFVEDPARTAKYAGGVFALWYLTTWFSIPTVLGLSVLAAFIIPSVYRNHKKTIDDKYEDAIHKTGEYTTHTGQALQHRMDSIYTRARDYMGSKFTHTGETLKKKDQ